VKRSWLGLASSLLALGLLLGGGACNTAGLTGPTPGASGGLDPEAIGADGGEGPRDGGRDAIVELDGGVIPTTSDVTIQVQPTDSGQQLLAAIAGAQKSVHMTMYLLTNNAVIQALGNLKSAGRDVKVVLNQTFPQGGNANQSAYNELQQLGVEVRWAPPGYQYTHAKTIIIDGEKVVIMTMNLTQTSASSNREYIATDYDPDDVADAETMFMGDFNNQSTFVNGKLVVSPQNASPVDARTRLKALIDSAATTLDVESQTLSDTALVDAIIAAHQGNVQVRVVLSNTFEPTDAQQAAMTKLKENGVPLVGVGDPMIHAKAIVADGKRAFVGSHNLTSNALFNNREIGVITDAPAEVKKVRDTIAADFAIGTPP
jgi:cardiolipin synthase A/B